MFTLSRFLHFLNNIGVMLATQNMLVWFKSDGVLSRRMCAITFKSYKM